MRLAGVAVVALLLGGCQWAGDRIVPAATTEGASWAYVDEAWGGLAVADSRTTAHELSLTFRGVHAPSRIDSGICLRAVHARTQAARVLVRCDRSVCPQAGGTVPLAATIPRPPAGTYDVVLR